MSPNQQAAIAILCFFFCMAVWDMYSQRRKERQRKKGREIYKNNLKTNK